MLKSKLRKAVSIGMVAISLMSINPICAHAEWIDGRSQWGAGGFGGHEGTNSYITAWWYKEGDSYAVGWRLIDGKWYYFDSQGYMRTGWTLVDGKWYYLDSNGEMLCNTVKDGYTLVADGHWDTSIPLVTSSGAQTTNTNVQAQMNSFTYEKALELAKGMCIEGYNTKTEVDPEQKFDHYSNRPYFYVNFIDVETNQSISSCELYEDGECTF